MTALLTACGRCGDGGTGGANAKGPAKTPATSATAPGAAPTAVPAAPKPEARQNAAAAQARAAATALLEAWKAAQNQGDAERYFALYEPKEFKGLKRTHRGKVASFDFPAWRKDRSSMFKNAFEVAVEEPRIETWLDDGSALKPGVSSLRFLQRWRSKRYADHGPKSLLLWRDPRDGKTRIVFEELLLSRPGWQEPEREPPSLPAVVAAATVEEMTAALRGAKLDASNAGDVSLALDDPHARGLALKAVAGMGSLDCLPEIMIGTGCGEEEADWGLVLGATPPPLDHPYTRRELVMPLLSGAALPHDALPAAAEPLIAILSKEVEDEDARDPELVGTALAAVEALPEAARLPFLAAALKARQWDELVAPHLAKLGPESLYALWDQSSNPLALRPLSLTEHAARIAEIQHMAVLPNDLMLQVVPVLASQDRRELLARLSDDGDCELAMTAAAALATLGDRSKLPTWQGATDDKLGWRAICLLRHDPDRARAQAELARFFHPKRAVRSVTLDAVVNDFASSDEEAPEPTAEEAALAKEAAELLNVEKPYGRQTAAIAPLSGAGPQLLFDTRAFDPDQTPESYDLVVMFEEGGHAYVDYIGTYSFQWIGCPC